MTERVTRNWIVVVHEWAEYGVRVAAQTKQEAEERAVEVYERLDCLDTGVDWAEAQEEEWQE